MTVKDVWCLEYGKPSTRVFYENEKDEIIEIDKHEYNNLSLKVIGITVIDYDIACFVSEEEYWVNKINYDLLKAYKE